MSVGRIAIFQPTDPLGHVPGGIDTIIRGILKWAPPDLEYTLFGATSDDRQRPVGVPIAGLFGNPNARFVPLLTSDANGQRGILPLIVQYVAALSRLKQDGRCADFAVLDFHRIETLALFRNDPRPKNVTVHQDMSIIRDKGCDILWRHAPWMYEWIERRVFRSADRIYTVRQTAVVRYEEAYPEVSGRIGFLPTWVDTTQFYPPQDDQERSRCRAALRTSLGIDDASVRVLVTVGRLDRQKDPLLLLRAFRTVAAADPQIHLVLIGDGVLRGEVETAIRESGLGGRVTLLGVKRSLEIAEIHRGADLFVMSSAYEGMPIAVLEALGAGLPVVTTPVGEVGLVITGPRVGTICRDFEADTFAAEICAALANPELGADQACSRAVAPYRDQQILAGLYANHRRQSLLLK